MDTELKQAIHNAKVEIRDCDKQKLGLTSKLIKANIRMVKRNPLKFSREFIKQAKIN